MQAGHDQQAAAVAYRLTMTSMSVAFSLFNLYARRCRRQLEPLDWIGFSTGLALWPLATLAALVNVGLALALFAFIVLFYLALPIIREDRERAAHSSERGAPRLAHEDARAAEADRGDLGEDP